MANYFYVKSGYGTNTGDTPFTSKQVGVFNATISATQAYDSLDALKALANKPIGGDVIILSHLHNKIYGATINIELANKATGVVLVVSVNDAEIETPLAGAKESTSVGNFSTTKQYDYSKGYSHAVGLTFEAVAGTLNLGAHSSTHTFDNCIFLASSYILHGAKITTINCGYTCSYIRVNFTKIISAIIATTHARMIFKAGGSLQVISCDMSACTSSVVVYTDYNASTNGLMSFFNCKMPVGFVGFVNSAYDDGLEVSFNSCGVVGEYYSDRLISTTGEYSEELAIYLHHKYNDVIGLSKRVSTFSSPVGNGIPFRCLLCELPAQNLSVTDTTYRVNLLLDTDTVTTLTDTTCWVELSHNDNTSLALGKIVSSRNSDILATGNELTPSAEVWQGTLPTNTKAYQIDITLSAASLPNVTNGSVVIYLNLAVANTDVYACPAVMIGT